jgi:hypothetical protein
LTRRQKQSVEKKMAKSGGGRRESGEARVNRGRGSWF